MKVLMCSPVDGTGGISRWTNALIDFYNNHVDSDIVLRNFYPSKGEQTLGSTHLFKRIKNGLDNYFPLIKGFKHQIEDFEPDVIHLVSSASLGLLRDYFVIKIAKRCKKKVFIHFHFGRIPDLFEVRNWEFRLLKRIINMVDCTLVLDERSMATLVKYGYDKVKLLPNPLSEQVNNLIKSNDTWSPKNKTILFVGQVLPEKGIRELITACKLIGDFELRILGLMPNGYERELIEIAGNYWDKISILGNQPIETVIYEMSHCGIFVLPTYTEGFPNVIIEAMGVGCPIITTPVGAIPEMLQINSSLPCGICVPVKDIGALKEAIVELSSNTELRRKFSRLAKDRANAAYSMNSIWRDLCNIWMS